jgi:hypothetical protein
MSVTGSVTPMGLMVACSKRAPKALQRAPLAWWHEAQGVTAT